MSRDVYYLRRAATREEKMAWYAVSDLVYPCSGPQPRAFRHLLRVIHRAHKDAGSWFTEFRSP